ncbi:type II toxin-antitoxin system VapC family toxin [Spirosoma harenae]
MLKAITEADKVFVSPINFYEMAIKIKIGRSIGSNRPIRDAIYLSHQSGFAWKPIEEHHLTAYQAIPLFDHHRDPFDRILLATALADDLTILSSDHNFPLYSDLVTTIW